MHVRVVNERRMGPIRLNGIATDLSLAWKHNEALAYECPWMAEAYSDSEPLRQDLKFRKRNRIKGEWAGAIMLKGHAWGEASIIPEIAPLPLLSHGGAADSRLGWWYKEENTPEALEVGRRVLRRLTRLAEHRREFKGAIWAQTHSQDDTKNAAFETLRYNYHDHPQRPGYVVWLHPAAERSLVVPEMVPVLPDSAPALDERNGESV